MSIILGKLSGKLSPFVSLKGTIRAIAVESQGPVVPPPENPYTGEYEVTPQASGDQILETANKTLTKDLIIKEIPYHEVTNLTGGITVNIAERVNANARRGSSK